MEKFNEWLKKEYRIHWSDQYQSYGINGFFKTNIEMIGYMEKYLLLKYGVGIGNKSNIYEKVHAGEKFGEIRYNQLLNEIKERYSR